MPPVTPNWISGRGWIYQKLMEVCSFNSSSEMRWISESGPLKEVCFFSHITAFLLICFWLMLIDLPAGSIPSPCPDGCSLVSCLFPLHWVVLSAFTQPLSLELSSPVPFSIHFYLSHPIIPNTMAFLLNGQYRGCPNQLESNKSSVTAGRLVN